MLDSWAYRSPLRRAHPAERLLLALGLLLEGLVLPPLSAGPVILGLACFAAVVGARVPIRVFLRGMAVPAGFLLSGAVVTAVSLNLGGSGDAGGYSIGLTLSPDGARAAGLLCVRALAAAACLLLLACSTPPPDLARCCARCRVPVELIDLMLLVYRFLYLLAETAQAIGRSQASRLGYGDLRRSIRSTAALLSSLFVRSLDRAKRLEDGLAGRGFSGTTRMLRVGRPISPLSVAVILLILTIPALPVAVSALWGVAP